MLLSFLFSVATASTAVIEPPLRWNPSAWSQDVTECDRLAAHPSDPDKLTPGVTQTALLAAGADKAISACQAAIATDPNNPRLNYQLARSLGYAGRGNEAQTYRDRAVAGDYPQALFVVGFVYLTGQGAPKDACKAAPLLRRSALAGRFAGLVGYPHYVANGAFAQCSQARINKVELLRFLDQAQTHSENNDYYRGVLIESVRSRINAMRAAR